MSRDLTAKEAERASKARDNWRRKLTESEQRAGNSRVDHDKINKKVADLVKSGERIHTNRKD